MKRANWLNRFSVMITTCLCFGILLPFYTAQFSVDLRANMSAQSIQHFPMLECFIRQVRIADNGDAPEDLQNLNRGSADSVLFRVPLGHAQLAASSPRKPTTAKRSGSASIVGCKLVFILDASGSMWGKVEGTVKITIAKEVLSKLIRDLADGCQVGLVAYGHRRKGDCTDVEQLVPLAPLDKATLIEKISSINPKGKTPITRSVQITAEKLKALENETTIVLVSDGRETCEGDPCALVKQLKESGQRFIIHVIGFDVTEEERAQLECIAKVGGGKYYAAKNAGEFQAATRQVVKETQNVGLLRVKAMKGGQMIPVEVYVYPTGQDERVAYDDISKEETAEFRLQPGTYDIKVVDYRVKGQPTVWIKNISIELNQTVEKIAECGAEGILRVKAQKEGQMFRTEVYVYPVGQDERVAYDDISKEETAEFRLQPGIYDIKVVDTDVEGSPTVWVKGVKLGSGQIVEKIAEFIPEGVLKITALRGGQVIPVEVYAYPAGQDERVAYDDISKEETAEFRLQPGTYDIKVSDDSGETVKMIEGIRIEAGKTKIIEVAF